MTAVLSFAERIGEKAVHDEVIRILRTSCDNCQPLSGEPCRGVPPLSFHESRVKRAQQAPSPIAFVDDPKPDEEIAAVGAAARALLSLDSGARCRVLGYLLTRFAWPEVKSSEDSTRNSLASTIRALAGTLDSLADELTR